jgi:hypothetical protein
VTMHGMTVDHKVEADALAQGLAILILLDGRVIPSRLIVMADADQEKKGQNLSPETYRLTNLKWITTR